jgi:signal transduction histidine kinase
VVLQTLVFGLLLIAVRRLMELVWELEATRDQVAALAVSDERLRLARDLHDLLGRNLSVIALKSELARKLLGRDPAAAEREVRDVETVARESLQGAGAVVPERHHDGIGDDRRDPTAGPRPPTRRARAVRRMYLRPWGSDNA